MLRARPCSDGRRLGNNFFLLLKRTPGSCICCSVELHCDSRSAKDSAAKLLGQRIVTVGVLRDSVQPACQRFIFEI